jgi:hypothetical protein
LNLRRRLLKKNGFILVASVILIVFVAIVIIGTTIFIVQRLSQNQAYQVKSKAIYLAQAGIQNAIYWYRYRDISANGYFSLGRTNLDANNFFVLGANAAELLMVNTNGSYLYPTSGSTRFRYLYGLTIQNATNSKTITIDRMIVTWNNTRRLRVIRINGSNRWTGTLSSPADCNITNWTLNTTPSIYNINYLQFDGIMTGATISTQFVMTDASTKTLTVFSVPASQNNSFTVNSTGKTIGSNIYRTAQATYNALTAKVTKYDEINTEITP